MTCDSFDVVIPAYQRAHCIADAIRSVLRQTYPVSSIIVVDDCSQDGTADVAASVASPLVQVVKLSSNRGVAGARNAGATFCRQPFIAFLDSDDEWLTDSAALLMDKVARLDLDVAVGHFIRVDSTGHEDIPECGWDGSDPLAALVQGCVMGLSWTMLRRATFDRLGPFDETLRTCEDWDLFLRLAHAKVKFGRVDQAIAKYRDTGDPRLMHDKTLLAANEKTIRSVYGLPSYSGESP